MEFFEKSAAKLVFGNKFAVVLMISMIIVSPNLWWNYQHDFVTASHTSDNIGWRGGILHPFNGAEFVLSQFGVFGPILFTFFLIALVRFWREGFDENQKLLVIFSLPVLMLIIFQALISKAYANWAAVTYVGATILIADILVNRVPLFWHKLSLGIHLLLFGRPKHRSCLFCAGNIDIA